MLRYETIKYMWQVAKFRNCLSYFTSLTSVQRYFRRKEQLHQNLSYFARFLIGFLYPVFKKPKVNKSRQRVQRSDSHVQRVVWWVVLFFWAFRCFCLLGSLKIWSFKWWLEYLFSDYIDFYGGLVFFFWVIIALKTSMPVETKIFTGSNFYLFYTKF